MKKIQSWKCCLTFLLLASCQSSSKNQHGYASAKTSAQRLVEWQAEENHAARQNAIEESKASKIVYFRNDAALARTDWYNINITEGLVTRQDFQGAVHEVFFAGKLLATILIERKTSSGTELGKRYFRHAFVRRPKPGPSVIHLSQSLKCTDDHCLPSDMGRQSVYTGSGENWQEEDFAVSVGLPFNFESPSLHEEAFAYFQKEFQKIYSNKKRFEKIFVEFAADPYKTYDGKRIGPVR